MSATFWWLFSKNPLDRVGKKIPCKRVVRLERKCFYLFISLKTRFPLEGSCCHWPRYGWHKKQAAQCDTGRAMWKSFHFLNSDPSYKRPQQNQCVMPKQSHSNELHSIWHEAMVPVFSRRKRQRTACKSVPLQEHLVHVKAMRSARFDSAV